MNNSSHQLEEAMKHFCTFPSLRVGTVLLEKVLERGSVRELARVLAQVLALVLGEVVLAPVLVRESVRV
jgi:hypothetical protein